MRRDQEWETLADAALDFCRAICDYGLVFARSAVGWWVGLGHFRAGIWSSDLGRVAGSWLIEPREGV
jgi:hypothetical protein